MNIEQTREEIVRMRRASEAWLERPGLTPAERADIQQSIEQGHQLERKLDEFLKLTLRGVQRYEAPALLDFITKEEDETKPT